MLSEPSSLLYSIMKKQIEHSFSPVLPYYCIMMKNNCKSLYKQNLDRWEMLKDEHNYHYDNLNYSYLLKKTTTSAKVLS